jgi:hypothetical protein
MLFRAGRFCAEALTEKFVHKATIAPAEAIPNITMTVIATTLRHFICVLRAKWNIALILSQRYGIRLKKFIRISRKSAEGRALKDKISEFHRIPGVLFVRVKGARKPADHF